jgi:hypothetical protein
MGKYDETDMVSEEQEETMTEKPQARTLVRGGWGSVDAVKNADSPFAQRLKIADEPQIIKFLNDEPYASWRQHWIERQGQKSFVCIGEFDDKGCPLCDSGDRPSVRIAFNVALLVAGEEPSIKSYEVGPRVIDQLKNFHTDPRTGPLTKQYWAVSKTGKGATTATSHQLVKDRDLEEWGISEIDDAELKSLVSRAYTADIISIPSRKDLIEIANEVD